MLIRRIQLENFCQHRRQDIRLVPGLNMIVGSNGAGKTNLLRAIQFAMIGDSGGEREKAADIYQGCGPKDRSFVQMEFSHGEHEMTVTRSLQPSSNELVIGEASWSTVNTINEEIGRRLGASKRQISDYVFVKQRGVDSMFDQKPAERASSLASLFGLENAEKIWRYVGEFTKDIEVPTTLMGEAAIMNELTAAQTAADDIVEEMESIDIPEDVEEYSADQNRIITGFDTRLRLANDRDIVQKRIDGKLGELGELAEETKVIQVDIDALADALVHIAGDVATAKKNLSQWQTYHATQAAREQLAKDEADYQKQRADFGEIPDEPIMDDEQRERLTKLRATCATLRQRIKDLDSMATICPTCNQELPDAHTVGEQLVNLRETLQIAEHDKLPLEMLAEEVEEFKKWREECQAFADWKASLQERAAALSTLTAPNMPESDCKEILEEQESFSTALVDLQKAKTEIEQEQAKVGGALEQLRERLANVTKQLQDIPVVLAEEADTARSNLGSLRNKLGQRNELSRNLAVAQATIQRWEDLLGDVRATLESAGRIREVVAHLEEVRNVFHRNEAPRVVSYTYIEQMLEDVNRTLEIFEAPFRVEMDEYLGFTARFLDGVRVQPDRRLSVGERIVLAMAFRITVNATFAGQVGLLIMDEPTAGLDEHNLGCLPRALERLRELSHERGLQVLFVTHEPRIGHLFDHQITLNNEGS